MSQQPEVSKEEGLNPELPQANNSSVEDETSSPPKDQSPEKSSPRSPPQARQFLEEHQPEAGQPAAETAGPSEEAETTATQPPPMKQTQVINKTGQRIGISGQNHRQLVMAAFGSRVISSELLKKFDYEAWLQRDLIALEPVQVIDTSEAESVLFGCGFFLVLLAIVGVAVEILRANLIFWGVFAILFIFTLILLIWMAGKGKLILRQTTQTMAQSFNVILIIVLGLGLPGLVIYFFGQGRQLVTEPELSLGLLGRSLQFAFIGIASLLPALLYFLFDRQQLEKVQQNFVREVLRLDPQILTVTEAETKYGRLIEETYGSSQATSFLLGTGSPILISTILFVLGWLLVLSPVGPVNPVESINLQNLFSPGLSALNFGFLGAYFFALNLIFRRYVRSDLTPKAYSHIIVRLLLTTILVWTVSTLTQFSGLERTFLSPIQEAIETQPATGQPQTPATADDGDQAKAQPAPEGGETAQAQTETGVDLPLLYVLAFFIGIFPETGFALLQDFLKNRLTGFFFPALRERLPLTDLDGINLYDRARLLEEGIENVENLAHHNLIELMLSTRIPTQRLVDLFDQAILYLHLGLEASEIKEVRKKLRQCGIRTATDLEQAYKTTHTSGRTKSEKEALLQLIDEPATGQGGPQVKRLQTIIDVQEDDEWMAYLRNWRALSQATPRIYTLVDFDLREAGAAAQPGLA